VKKIHLVLLIHAHQPVGNFDAVLEKIYQQSYLPFLEHLAKHPTVKIGLHYTGPLLEWLEARHPEFLSQLAEVVSRGQAEMVGGGFYEPILVSIPERDQIAQLRLMREHLAKQFGCAPGGAWLAERVWEPNLPSVLEAAKIEYTLLDDAHFQCAGIELEDMFGYYVAEDRGAKVKVIPGLKSLRYLVPFRGVPEIIDLLRGAAERHPGGMAAMGDDCEKFGAWPGTFEHCYTNGWLERFFTALETNREWLITTTPGEYLAEHPPLGRAALPSASYTELMQWVLPMPARQHLMAIEHEFAARPDVQRFLRGGIWRGFLYKYPEVNLMHKKMLRVSKKLHGARSQREGTAGARKVAEARTHLLRAQCNDAYWHGVFGGVYSPHLRTELWRELIRAETLLESAGAHRSSKVRSERMDFDADGAEEIYVTAPKFAALVKPSDGATVAAMDFRPTAVALINSLQRRPEPYHTKLAEAAGGISRGIASIHDQVRVKEPGLEKRLRYDRWARNTFRLLLFPGGKTRTDYDMVKLEESALFAGGAYAVKRCTGGKVIMEMEGPLDLPGGGAETVLSVTKEAQASSSEDGFRLRCGLQVRMKESSTATALKFQAGLEIVLNLLAPNEVNRFFETGPKGDQERQPLNWSGEADGPAMRIVDEWQNVSVSIEALSVPRFWIAPIETVSESEEGFERVYQGSQILAVWPVELKPGGKWEAGFTMNVSKAHS
jgi:hypothetical protein